MIRKIVALLQAGVHVGVVTAAGYPGEAARFEGRLKGLLVRPRRCVAARHARFGGMVQRGADVA